MSEPKNFSVNKNKDLLIYTFSNSAYYSVKYIVDELPPELNPKLATTTLSLNLQVAKEIFGFEFKKSFFGHYK